MNKLKLRAGNRCPLPVVSCPLTANRQPTTVNPRRYFYPSLEELPYVSSKQCDMATDIAKRVMCLPLYVGLRETSLKIIVNTIN